MAQPPVRQPVREGNLARLMLDDGEESDKQVDSPRTVARRRDRAKKPKK
jgi:hypothetical protein